VSVDTYDAAGNTTLSAGSSSVYDFENRLIQHGNTTITYDGDGNRVREVAGGITTTYLVDRLNPTGLPQVLVETSSDGSTRIYVYGQQRIRQTFVAPSSSAALISFYVYDGHGSVRALADSSGAITDTYDYDSFGTVINRTGASSNNYLFAGEQFDPALGVYYMRARYYDQTKGRFWTMDPFEGSADDPLSLHKNLYASADPVDRSDPSGNQDLLEEDAAVSIQGELASQGVIIPGALKGAVIGGIVGCIGGAISKDSTCEEGAFSGVISGALFGAVGAAYGATAFGASTAGRILFAAVSSGLAGNAAYDAYDRGDYALAAFDALTFAGGAYLSSLNVSEPAEPTIGAYPGRIPASVLPEELQAAMKDINPTGCKTNCTTVAWLLDYILGGGQKVSAPATGLGGYTVRGALEAGYSLTTLKNIQYTVRAGGAGTRGVVVGIPGGSGGGAHMFNVINFEGFVYFLDGQSNSVARPGNYAYFLFGLTNSPLE